MTCEIKVIKRDGDCDNFNMNKIRNAIIHCFKNTNNDNYDINNIITQIHTELTLYNEISVEQIQDIVELTLMKFKHYNEAKNYILYRKCHEDIRHQTTYVNKLKSNFDIVVPWGPIGYPTYKRTYSRRIGNNESAEEFKDTILRVLHAANTQLQVKFTNKELIEAYTYMMQLKCSVAGRFLWQLGTNTVNRYGLMSLQNCAFVKVNEPIKPFTWIFDIIMLGVGVGVSIERKNVSCLPKVINKEITITRQDTKDADYIIPDSREGWVNFLEKVLEAYFYKGRSFTYSTLLIRSAGSLIKSFGGTASGPEELCNGIKNICDLFNKRLGQQLTSVDCMDIVDILASIAISGNIRRSAIIMLGDYDDEEYMNAKRWDLGNIPNWRCNSNNSVICDDTNKLPESFWDGYIGNGEPYGLVNVSLAKQIGRLKDGDKYPDPELEGTNPCLTGDTYILTDEGTILIKELIGKQFNAIINGRLYKSTSKGFWHSGNKEVYKITFKNGIEIKATANHKFKGVDKWYEVKDLKVHDTLLLSDNTDYKWHGVTHETILSLFREIFETCIYTIFNDKVYMKLVYNEYNDYDKPTLLIIQQYLLSMGIVNKVALCYTHYEIVLSIISCIKFDNIIHINNEQVQLLMKQYKQQREGIMTNIYDTIECDKFYSKIVNIESVGCMDVYDCTIPEIHSFSANGLISHNCAEQGLANYETCCLGELFLPNITSFEEIKKVCTVIYRICKHSLLMPCHHQETENIVHKNMRIGIGITGYLQSTQEQKEWLSPLYEYIREYDKSYSKTHNMNASIKLTTVKPSGTLSLLPGVTPGAHPGIYKFYIRRIRFSATNKIYLLFKNNGYDCEYQINFDGTIDYTTIIVSFPCKYPEHTRLAKDMTAIDQLNVIKELQTNWSDNSVSVTIYYRLNELPQIKEWLNANYKSSVKSCSFLLHNEHGFKQAPYEETTEEQYINYSKRVKPITKSNDFTSECDYSSECSQGICPIR